MIAINSISIAILLVFMAVVFISTTYIFYNFIYTPHKIKSTNLTLTELLGVLNTVINTELTLYEKNVFTKKGALTNSNFENFYRDIVNTIVNSLSDEFFLHIELYIKQDAVVSIICRSVKDFLVEKVNTVY